MSGVSKVSYDLKLLKVKNDSSLLSQKSSTFVLVLRNTDNASAFMNINSSQIPESKTCVYERYR